jgi:hypothetical protein
MYVPKIIPPPSPWGVERLKRALLYAVIDLEDYGEEALPRTQHVLDLWRSRIVVRHEEQAAARRRAPHSDGEGNQNGA